MALGENVHQIPTKPRRQASETAPPPQVDTIALWRQVAGWWALQSYAREEGWGTSESEKTENWRLGICSGRQEFAVMFAKRAFRSTVLVLLICNPLADCKFDANLCIRSAVDNQQ